MAAAYAYPAPQTPAQVMTVAPGTPVHTRWGWVTAGVPVASLVLTVVQLLAMSSILQDYFRELSTIIAAQRTDPYAALEMTSLMSSMVPMTFLTMALSVLSWGLLALGVVAAATTFVLSTAWSIWLTFAFFQQFIALRGTIA
ncbi:hypothetical protein [Microbacterium azadirachtae]|uniref:hypothetical protein n=1 Tax=Microbacterium azadirachtae TaxID=582680 RepID=UPI003F753D64